MSAAVALVYDMTRRMFGRVAGFVAGLGFALTPITVAIARHNNPDELLILCCVAALWFALRALETGRTKWLVLCGVCVGLGFETKMGVALFVVPGIALAWMWSRWGETWRGRLTAFRQLLAGGVAMVVVGAGLAVARDVDPGGGSAVDLRDLRQQHLVTDLWIQRLGPGRRANGWASGRRRAGRRRRLRRQSVRRRHRTVPAAPVGARRSGWVAARVRRGRRARAARAHAPSPARSAHRLADRRRRRVRDHGRRLQLRVGDLPSLLRVVPGAVRGGAGRRRRRPDAAAVPRRRGGRTAAR